MTENYPPPYRLTPADRRLVERWAQSLKRRMQLALAPQFDARMKGTARW